MKIVLIGAGSFVFAPTVLQDIIERHRLNGSELVLVDINQETVDIVTGIAKQMAQDLEITLTIQGTIERKNALPGADAVIVSASPQGARRWKMDYEILKQNEIADQARECGGVGGMMNSFRSITLLMAICEDMERYCPQAILYDVTNPMPRVVTAIERYTNIQAIGFCNIAYKGKDGYEFLPTLIERTKEDVEIVTAGLNHFAWLLSMKDKLTGKELLPDVEERLMEVSNHDTSETNRELLIMKRWYKAYGGVVAGAVDHHAEYLPLQSQVHYTTTPPYHGSGKERSEILSRMKEVANGKRHWREVMYPSWEHPIDVMVALEKNQTKRFDIVNIPNKGYLSDLPDGRIVEIPARTRQGKILGEKVPPLPSGVASLCRSISDVHEAVAEAAVRGDKTLAKNVIEMDIAITNKKAANKALDKMLRVHKDVLPQFN